MPDPSYKFSVAPMMDGTDRHCRYFHRLMSRRARLYTEMVTADAVIHGDRDYLLGFDETEHPLALQLGGSDPHKLTEAAQIGESFGYDEVNLNVGCPSDRVQSGAFGACLMASPELVAQCVLEMQAKISIPVTVKCRIGIDEQDPAHVLPDFIEKVAGAGCKVFIIHARKAWLKGLSPKDNRTIPPLDYELVFAMKRRWPDLAIVLNGGLTSLSQCKEYLPFVDGVMLGSEPYANPWILAEVDHQIFGEKSCDKSRDEIAGMMQDYVERVCCDCRVKPHAITRHMIGLYRGTPGARAWRRALSTHGALAPVDNIMQALEQVRLHQVQAAEKLHFGGVS